MRIFDKFMYTAKHDLYKMLIKITDILIFFLHKTVLSPSPSFPQDSFEPVSLLTTNVARQLTPTHKPLHANKGVGLRKRVHVTVTTLRPAQHLNSPLLPLSGCIHRDGSCMSPVAFLHTRGGRLSHSGRS